MDLICLDDLDEFAGELDDPLAELAQDVFHVLIEPHGSNPDDPDRGLGLEDVLSGPYDPSIKGRIESGLRRDPRIAGVQARITQLGEGAFRTEILLEADGEELGLVFDADGRGTVRRIA